MHSFKIAIVGPKSSGKTAFIRSVSEIAVLSTRRGIGADRGGAGDGAGIDMDFGRITVADDIVIYLFGTPGNDRVSQHTWKTLSEGLIGFVVLVDAEAPEALDDARETVEFLGHRTEVPFVVAANRLGSGQSAQLQNLRAALGLSADVPLLPVDALDGTSARTVLADLVDEAVRRAG
jgi:uncharacterized protein